MTDLLDYAHARITMDRDVDSTTPDAAALNTLTVPWIDGTLDVAQLTGFLFQRNTSDGDTEFKTNLIDDVFGSEWNRLLRLATNAGRGVNPNLVIVAWADLDSIWHLPKSFDGHPKESAWLRRTIITDFIDPQY